MATTTAPARPRQRPPPLPRLENPFSVKVFQVFTGFGIGCGVGVGVGRPIHVGAVPMLQQVMSAARGATDAFSGVGRHANYTLKKLGLKNIEAGIGCGVGIGYGFGVGLALKPRVLNEIQTSVLEIASKLMANFKDIPGLPSVSSPIMSSSQSTVDGNPQSSNGTLVASESNIPSNVNKVLSNFLQDPLFRSGMEIDNNQSVHVKAGNLQTMNDVLQMLLSHQQLINELKDENQKLLQVLADELGVSTDKLLKTTGEAGIASYPCSGCFKCRRRSRKAVR